MIGDANVDMEIRLPQGGAAATHGNPEPHLFGGGSAANTAAALARLGVECRFVGTVGNDDYGRLAASSLDDVGVDTRSLEVVSGAPTVMVMVVVPPDGERLIYVWPPSGGAHGSLTVEQAVAALTGADWVHVSGICLRVNPARDAVLAAMAKAKASAIPVSLDLNLRLENWGWDDGFRGIVAAAVARADVVMGAASDEIVPLTGIDDPIEAAASLAGSERLVIARIGAAGAIACSKAGVVTVPSFEVDVRDTVGAGDAFNAGFIAAHLGGADLSESLRWGNAVAALTIAASGARSTPTRLQTEALMAR